MQMTNWKHWAVGSVAALTIMAGGIMAADSVSAADPVTNDVAAFGPGYQLMAADGNQLGRAGGPRGAGYASDIDGQALLAEQLGITVEDLDAAQTEARTKVLDEALANAVANGTLTQQQADALKVLQGLGNGRMMPRLPMNPGAMHNVDAFQKYDDYLAEALGITVEELDAARIAAHQAAIAQAVADGSITQEEADDMLTRMELQPYFQAEMETARETALQKAVTDGVITQEDADDILNGEAGFGPRMNNGHRGGKGGAFHGMQGRGFNDDGMMQRGPGGRSRMNQGQGPGVKSQSGNAVQNGIGANL